MPNFPRWKLSLILLICALGILFALPNLLGDEKLARVPSWFPSQRINFGLDLKGGSHLLLQVDFPYYLKEQLENSKDNLRKELRKEKIGYSNLRIEGEKLTFLKRDGEDQQKINKTLANISELTFDHHENKYFLQFSKQTLDDFKKKIISQSIEIIRRRVDETGTKEPIIQRQGEDKILLQVPGLSDPDHLKNLLGKTAKLTFHLVNENSAYSEIIPFDTILMDMEPDAQGKIYKIPVYKRSLLNGDLLSNATVAFEQSKPVVAFEFNNLGAKKFAEITSQNVGKRLAIVLDNKVICAPNISVAIPGGSGHISGGYTTKTANELALLLRAGALPAPLNVVEERSVGPSLGELSIFQGRQAAIISILAVAVFMILVYGVLGLFANIALCFNLVFLIALLSMLQATLTLPGIAGIVLTMGMSVDANVLIFERIREESKKGLSAFKSLEQGFSHAFSTIIDSNLTTILVGAFLYGFGSGGIKGFAVTLVLGILTSMFSAITLTKLMLSQWLYKFRPKSFIN